MKQPAKDYRFADKIASRLVTIGSMLCAGHHHSLLLELVLLRRQSEQANDLPSLLLRRGRVSLSPFAPYVFQMLWI